MSDTTIKHGNLIILPDESDWCDKRWIVWAGACGATYALVWATSLQGAIDQFADWAHENAPGLLADEQVYQAYRDAIREIHAECLEAGNGLEEDREYLERKASERAEVDCSPVGDGHWMLSWEWGLACEDPDRETIERYKRGER